jgi:hypothetical protein
MTRYFKVVDQTIVDAYKKHAETGHDNRKKANAWAKTIGAERIHFYRRGLFGSTFGGVKPREITDELRAKCRKNTDRNGLTGPAKSRDPVLYAEWHRQKQELCTSGKEIEDLVGFNELSFFPTSPGMHYNLDSGFLGWIMPDHVTTEHLKGCVEITNIDWIEATKDAES